VRVALTPCGLEISTEFLEALLPCPREKIVTGGWRAGKSTEGAAEIWADWHFHEVQYPAVYWIVGQTYQAAHTEYGYLFEWAGKLGWVERADMADDGPRRMVLKNNTVIETRSSQHPERLASDAVDGALVVEAGQQSGEVRTMLRGRVLDKRGWRIYTGTLEDAENHQRWAWYEQLADEWRRAPTQDHAAYSLPTWANRTVFPGGREDPEILLSERELSAYQFARRIAGEPTGVEHAIYGQLERERHMPVGGPSLNTVWVEHVIGADPGGVHNCAVCVVGRDAAGYYWLRDGWAQPTDDLRLLSDVVGEFKRKYNCWRGRTDPTQPLVASALGFDYAHRGMMRTELGGNVTAREQRIATVSTLLNSNPPGLRFDINNEFAREAFEEARLYHRRVTPSGKFEIVREGEDRVAALEYAMEEFVVNSVDYGNLNLKGKALRQRRRPVGAYRP